MTRSLTRLLRDPLTHFVVAGGVIFAAYATFSPQAQPSADPMRIELTRDDLRQLALSQIAQGLPLPDPGQLHRLAEERAMQRILAREAAAFGLDRDDDVIERRLAQKMDFLLADLSQLNPPTGDDLAAWYAAHAAGFTRPARASFRHVYFSPDGRGSAAAEAAAAAALPTLAGLAPSSPALAAIGDRFMFQDYYGGRDPEAVARELGPEFAAALFAGQPGRWIGPIRSGYGWHLVYIDSLEPARVPALDEIEADVRAAWTDARYKEIRQRAEDDMRARYTVVVPDLDPADLGDLAAPRTADAMIGGL
ncbi:peptidylprolyl isomerase [Amaricoccus sp.]|uniref:peptidylprolyl isomerase n=1 Tax=Amaricoccus sp. TaxID=1872485 RepID=UPI001B55C529|nr:peptidylprolyl isomerase [Amaricoccus sp.]MBP7003562.1 peptidyl-prolyl cis-trans isomerase [Amaricoccus sp.]